MPTYQAPKVFKPGLTFDIVESNNQWGELDINLPDSAHLKRFGCTVKDVKDFTKWCFEYLGIPSAYNCSNVVITFLNRKGNDKNTYGVAWSGFGSKPHRVEIYMSNISNLRQFFETIAHELVHCKQYAFRELVSGQWNGPDQQKQILIGKKWPAKYKRYWNKPQELQAWGNQAALVNAWSWKLALQGKSNLGLGIVEPD